MRFCVTVSAEFLLGRSTQEISFEADDLPEFRHSILSVFAQVADTLADAEGN
eukprot:SAG31_NODE_25314_length_463_cov_1.950549_1_plen_52_part_00